MKAHSLFLAFLAALGLLVPVALGLRGCGYYLTPETERPFHPQYEVLKPSGAESHGYGIAGTLLIILGVSSYSSRKRLRALRNTGSIRVFLEVHIFLCLVGPTLVLFHTTFKFGGLVAVGAWSMLAVVLSGIVGRYLYTQIPKTLRGQEMTAGEIQQERTRLTENLVRQSALSPADLDRIDRLLVPTAEPQEAGVLRALSSAFLFDLGRIGRARRFRHELARLRVPAQSIGQLERIALRRALFQRRVLVLEQSRRLFHLWHVIHLPFTIVMFVIVIVHVGVAIAFGYRWFW